jgi:hypothetical protein
MKDLFILAADKNAEFALKGALARPEAMGIRSIEFEIRTHPGRDGGMRKTGSEMVALLRRQYHHVLLVLDFEGCGTELGNAEALENQLDEQLKQQWNGKAKAIVIEPELDVWVWGSDNAIEEAIEWPPGKHIRQWLTEQGFEFDVNTKPTRPKEALESALRIPNLPRSSALYQHIAGKISLQKCKDEAFIRLRNQLLVWFPKIN